MGFFKDINTLKNQGKAMQEASTPGADLRAAKEKMAAVNASMALQTAAITTPANVVAGQVQVLAVGMGSGSVNGDTLLHVEVLVLAPGRPPVPASGPVAVPAVRVHRVQVGSVLPAVVDVASPTTWAFDWDRA